MHGQPITRTKAATPYFALLRCHAGRRERACAGGRTSSVLEVVFTYWLNPDIGSCLSQRLSVP